MNKYGKALGIPTYKKQRMTGLIKKKKKNNAAKKRDADYTDNKLVSTAT
jgi:hypothetical protein